MIEIENVEVYGFEAAIRGMRNPMNSWDKSDSTFESGEVVIGENDLKLMKSLAKAGTDHGKFLRMISVTADITAPLYWWKEYDTYKVGTVANSCSTMHKIHAKEFEYSDFSLEYLTDSTSFSYYNTMDVSPYNVIDVVISALNHYRDRFLATKDMDYWHQMIQLLPSSYNQRRTVQLNYEVLRNIDRPGRRRDHKLDEWREFCRWAETLPYFKEICTGGEE